MLEGLDSRPVTMRGQTARRTVRHFGVEYAYETGALAPGDPLPEPLLWLRDRCAHLISREAADLVQVLVARYPPGAGIGWHRDAPMFGSRIAGVSLLAPCRMRFQRTVGGVRSVAALELAPRSAYLLSGKARWSWQHTARSSGGRASMSARASAGRATRSRLPLTAGRARPSVGFTWTSEREIARR